MSISAISASPTPRIQSQPSVPANAAQQGAASQQSQGSQPLVGFAARQAARAQYLRTGIDKDAAIGDPDHDAGRAAQVASQPTTATASSASGTTMGSRVNLIA